MTGQGLKSFKVAEEGLTPRLTPKSKLWPQRLLLLWLVHEFYSQLSWKGGFFLYVHLQGLFWGPVCLTVSEPWLSPIWHLHYEVFSIICTAVLSDTAHRSTEGPRALNFKRIAWTVSTSAHRYQQNCTDLITSMLISYQVAGQTSYYYANGRI